MTTIIAPLYVRQRFEGLFLYIYQRESPHRRCGRGLHLSWCEFAVERYVIEYEPDELLYIHVWLALPCKY